MNGTAVPLPEQEPAAYTARRARLEDMRQFAAIAKLVHDELAAEGPIGRALAPPIDWNDSVDIAERIITKSISVTVEDAAGRIVGTSGLGLQKFYFSKAQYMADVWFWEHPEHRSLELFGTLLRATLAAGEATGLPVILSLMTTVDLERKEALFGRYMTRIGGIFARG